MTLIYEMIERVQPGVSGGGPRQWYATLRTQGIADLDELIRDIEKTSSFRGSNIRGVLYALEETISRKLAESMIVRLGVLGTLYPVISSAGQVHNIKLESGKIKRVTVKYKPGKGIVAAMREAGFRKGH